MSVLFIILTEAQADAVRGESSPDAWLVPVPLADGATWVLPERVLSDPAHASRLEALITLPRRAILPEEWPEADPDD